jgi:hypothetical protein
MTAAAALPYLLDDDRALIGRSGHYPSVLAERGASMPKQR